MLLNAQGIGHARKVNHLEVTILNTEKPDVVCLTETRLTEDLALSNRASFQSMHCQRGGVLTATLNSIQKHQFIKSFENYVIWTLSLSMGSEFIA